MEMLRCSPAELKSRLKMFKKKQLREIIMLMHARFEAEINANEPDSKYHEAGSIHEDHLLSTVDNFLMNMGESKHRLRWRDHK